MPNLTVTKNYTDGSVLTKAQLDSAFSSIETFVNTTKLDGTNLQTGSVGASTIAAGAVGSSAVASSAIDVANLTAAVLAQLVPAGAILPFASETAPSGYLSCDGSAISRSTYAALFNVIGDKHGSGDGSTTFNLPDYRGRFLRGWDHGSGLDPDAASRTAMASGGATGNHVGTTQGDQTRSHNHTLTDPGHAHTFTGGADASFGNGGSGPPAQFRTGTITVSTATTGITLANTGGNETRPTNAFVNYIIKI